MKSLKDLQLKMKSEKPFYLCNTNGEFAQIKEIDFINCIEDMKELGCNFPMNYIPQFDGVFLTLYFEQEHQIVNLFISTNDIHFINHFINW